MNWKDSILCSLLHPAGFISRDRVGQFNSLMGCCACMLFCVSKKIYIIFISLDGFLKQCNFYVCLHAVHPNTRKKLRDKHLSEILSMCICTLSFTFNIISAERLIIQYF